MDSNIYFFGLQDQRFLIRLSHYGFRRLGALGFFSSGGLCVPGFLTALDARLGNPDWAKHPSAQKRHAEVRGPK